MVVPEWVIYVSVGIVLIMSLYIWATRQRLDELEGTVEYIRSSYNKLLDRVNVVDKEIDNITDSLEKNHGSMQVCSSTLTCKISDLEQKVGILDKVVNSEMGFWASKAPLADIVEEPEEPEKPVDITEEPEETEAPDSLLANIVDPIMEKPQTLSVEAPEEKKEEVKKDLVYSHDPTEIIGYRWIFPGKEEHTPTFGCEYQVVGVLKGNDAKDIDAVVEINAVWDGRQFIGSEDMERFDKVYAYIKLPDVRDIWNHVFEIALSERGS